MPPKKDEKGGKSSGDKGGGGGGKQKKKKWSKGKTREQTVNLVIFVKATYDKLLKEIPPSKLITPSVVAERLKINGSLARRANKDLHTKGLIKPVLQHNRQIIFTRTTAS